MKLVVVRSDNDIGETIREVTGHYWNHIGMLVNNQRYLDFSHDIQTISNLDDIAGEYEIIDDGRDNYHMNESTYVSFLTAEYDTKAIEKLYRRFLRGTRDMTPIQSSSFHYTCSNLIAYQFHVRQKRFDPDGFLYHWSQTTPQDFYDVLGKDDEKKSR